LKIVIKRAKRPIITNTRLIEYLSKVFAIRIARGLKLYLNDTQVHKPDGFDSYQYELFRLKDGTPIFGNLKNVEKPRLNNIEGYKCFRNRFDRMVFDVMKLLVIT
jgi:hypothetical protein